MLRKTTITTITTITTMTLLVLSLAHTLKFSSDLCLYTNRRKIWFRKNL